MKINFNSEKGGVMKLKKGSIWRGVIVCALTIIAVVAIGFVVKYFNGGF